MSVSLMDEMYDLCKREYDSIVAKEKATQKLHDALGEYITTVESVDVMRDMFIPNRYARHIQMRDHLKEDLDSLTKAKKTFNPTMYLYNKFKSARIRVPITDDEKMELFKTPTLSKGIRLVVNQWKKENRVSKITGDIILSLLADEFREPISNVWVDFKLFCCDEDIEEWDKTHA